MPMTTVIAKAVIIIHPEPAVGIEAKNQFKKPDVSSGGPEKFV
jgi:hypothetical protein